MSGGRTSVLAEQAVPRHPSNRKVYDMLLQWGWEYVGDKKGFAQLRAPMGTETLEVQKPNSHDANATSVFLAIYKLTTQGDAELFWRGPSDLWTKMVADAREARAMEKRKGSMVPDLKTPGAVTGAVAASLSTGTWELPTAQPPAKAAPAPAVAPAASKRRRKTGGRPTRSAADGRVPTSDVLSAVLASALPTTVRDVAIRLGVAADDKQKVTDIQQGLAYLAKGGHVHRIKMGSYAPGPKPTVKASGTTPDAIRERLDAILPERPEPSDWVRTEVGLLPSTDPALHPPVKEEPMPERPTITADLDDESTIEAVLDLLFPDGFKARHMRYITPWVDATKTMMQEVRHG